MPTVERVLLHKDGPALWPDRYDEKSLLAISATIGTYFFDSLYQGEPRPKGGKIFKREWFNDKFVSASAVPADAERCRFWDEASSQDKGDWTVGLLMARTMDGRYFVENVVREQLSPWPRDQKILAVSAADASRLDSYRIRGEEEGGSSGKTAAEAFRKMLGKYDVRTERPTGDKVIRARYFASACEGGFVYIVKAPWNKVYLDELEAFDKGKHDDQVDASAGAYNDLSGGSMALRVGPSPTAGYRGRVSKSA